MGHSSHCKHEPFHACLHWGRYVEMVRCNVGYVSGWQLKKPLGKKGDSLRNRRNCDHCNHTPPLISNLCLWIANLHTWNRQATKDIGNIDFFFITEQGLICVTFKKIILILLSSFVFLQHSHSCLCFARRKAYMIRSQTHFVHIKLYFSFV